MCWRTAADLQKVKYDDLFIFILSLEACTISYGKYGKYTQHILVLWFIELWRPKILIIKGPET